MCRSKLLVVLVTLGGEKIVRSCYERELHNLKLGSWTEKLNEET
jgi:hypothetical protein